MSRDSLKIWIPIAIMAGILCAAGISILQWFNTTERFLPGVEIAGVKMEGLSKEEAALELKKQVVVLQKTNIHFYKESFAYDVKLSELCYMPDAEQIIEEVWAKERNRSFGSKLFNLRGSTIVVYQPSLQYQVPVIQSLVDSWNQEIGSECQNARIEIDASAGLKIIPEKPGRGVRAETVIAELPREWTTYPLEIDILLPIEETPPKVKAADLKGMGELASYTTQFKTYEINRSSNLRLAASSINSKMVLPGEVFSFNGTVGERTVNSGYSEAKVIVGNRFEPGLGGGVCQVSSTLYNAVLMSGLEIVERHNHGLAIVYVPLGLDATVSYGIQDFQFKNTTSSPIYIQAGTNGGELTIAIFGNQNDKVNVKLTHVVDQVISYGEIREVSSDLAPGEERVDHGGAAGYAVRAFRSFLDNDGNVIAQELLSSDYYQPLNRLVLVGPSADGANPNGGPPANTNPATEPQKPNPTDNGKKNDPVKPKDNSTGPQPG